MGWDMQEIWGDTPTRESEESRRCAGESSVWDTGWNPVKEKRKESVSEVVEKPEEQACLSTQAVPKRWLEADHKKCISQHCQGASCRVQPLGHRSVRFLTVGDLGDTLSWLMRDPCSISFHSQPYHEYSLCTHVSHIHVIYVYHRLYLPIIYLIFTYFVIVI